MVALIKFLKAIFFIVRVVKTGMSTNESEVLCSRGIVLMWGGGIFKN